MLTAHACPDPDGERITAYGQSADPTQHIRTQTSGEQPPVVPPVYTATDMCDRHPGSHPVEVLLNGCVSGGAAFWARKYASSLSKEVGSTALILLHDHEHSMELFGERGAMPEVPRAYAHDVGRLIAWTSSFVQRTIVLSSEENHVETALAWCVPIRLMTYVDDVSLVQSYGLVKKMVECAQANKLKLPSTGLIFLTRDTPGTHARGERILDTATRFLGIKLEVTDYLRYAESTRGTVRMCFSLPSDISCNQVMTELKCDKLWHIQDSDQRNPLYTIQREERAEAREGEIPEALTAFANKAVVAAVAAALADADAPKHPPPPPPSTSRTSLLATLRDKVMTLGKALLNTLRS